jgi:hypothetical protein
MATKRQDTLAAAPPFAAFGKTHENETHTTKNQGAQIVRMRPVQAVKAKLDENRARHPARATRLAATFENWLLTVEPGSGRSGSGCE